MKLYRLAWLNNAEYFEASTKYLQLADKAARTVAMLTERLDHHRNQGKQQIVVQHTTTVNATQAVVTDSVVKGKTSGAPSARLLAAVTDKPMEILETVNKRKLRRSGERIRKRNEHQPHAQGSRRTPDAPPDQNGQDSVVVRLRCAAGGFAGCTAPAVVRRRGNATGIIGTARDRRK